MGLLMKQHLGMMGTQVTPKTKCVIKAYPFRPRRAESKPVKKVYVCYDVK